AQPCRRNELAHGLGMMRVISRRQVCLAADRNVNARPCDRAVALRFGVEYASHPSSRNRITLSRRARTLLQLLPETFATDHANHLRGEFDGEPLQKQPFMDASPTSWIGSNQNGAN